jgi:D-glycero-D-manno-heptose 1,7-bisphosphate phosphatase
MAQRAVFVDRDDTILDDPGYIDDPSRVRLLPGVGPALRQIGEAGYLIVLVTNQSGIARGMLDEPTLGRIHQELVRQLAAQGARLDAIYYCPFHPEGTVPQYTRESDLRKPAPGMLLQAAQDMDIDLAGSWMIGDSLRDVEAGQRAGCRTILLSAGGKVEAEPGEVLADYQADDLAAAARIVLTHPD